MKFTLLILAAVVEGLPLHKELGININRVLIGEHNEAGFCQVPTLEDGFFNDVRDILGTTAGGDELLAHLEASYDMPVGAHTSLIPDAADASESGAAVADGESGDTDFPYGKMKPIATVGEMSVCPNSGGERIVGVPDGLGAYLKDDTTVRVVVQSESYGPLRFESYPFPVNEGMATFTGSHVQYVDYEREGLSSFLEHDGGAAALVKDMGEVIKTSYNLAGDLVGPRSADGPTESGAHFSNTDLAGNWVLPAPPSEADWLMQSLCSAHLEEKHQWGEGIGLEDDMFITNEEWMTYAPGVDFVGIAAHAVELATGEDYALGVLTQGGYEKIVEINPQNPNIVMLSPSGYNGAFDNYEKELEDRKAEYPHPHGGEWVWTKDIVPARIYIGVKGLDENGNEADDFLARNGLRFGQMYGFAVMKDTPDRDPWHKTVFNGAKVEGKWLPIDWRWDGVVKEFSHDGSWHYQIDPPGFPEYKFWNANGNTERGAKTEHNSPDPRPEKTAFIQSSTAGYFGHYYVTSDLSCWQPGDDFPAELDAEYYVYQGETDVRGQIDLGGKGMYRDGYDATVNYSKVNSATGVTRPTNTFEDIDGMEIAWDGTNLFAILQEDSGNYYGDRTFITKLEHEDDGVDLTYYFIASSGGKFNTRMTSGVGIPVGTNGGASSHEFSGIFDMSGLLAKGEDGSFVLSASETGYEKRAADGNVPINEKYFLIGLQAHNLNAGMIDTFQCDRGGQWLLYQPSLPM